MPNVTRTISPLLSTTYAVTSPPFAQYFRKPTVFRSKRCRFKRLTRKKFFSSSPHASAAPATPPQKAARCPPTALPNRECGASHPRLKSALGARPPIPPVEQLPHSQNNPRQQTTSPRPPSDAFRSGSVTRGIGQPYSRLWRQTPPPQKRPRRPPPDIPRRATAPFARQFPPTSAPPSVTIASQNPSPPFASVFAAPSACFHQLQKATRCPSIRECGASHPRRKRQLAARPRRPLNIPPRAATSLCKAI